MGELELINEMFETSVSEIVKLLPGFGKSLAIDGKAIDSYANRPNKNEKVDGRRDLDADTGSRNIQVLMMTVQSGRR